MRFVGLVHCEVLLLEHETISNAYLGHCVHRGCWGLAASDVGANMGAASDFDCISLIVAVGWGRVLP